MSFRPINDDHAVQSVAFSLHFDRAIEQSVIQNINDNSGRWQPDLPAVHMPTIFGFEFGPAIQTPQQSASRGVELSYLRPDGTPAWQLRVSGPGIVVECTRYTRWDHVWPSAKRYLSTAIDVIDESALQPGLQVAAVSLQYLDRFQGGPSGNDFYSVFQHNKYLADAIFTCGDFWHSHLGWFDPSFPAGRTLNNLNIDAKNDLSVHQAPIILDIFHLQQLRYDDKLPISEFRAAFDDIDVIMDKLHLQNKELVNSLLNPQMTQLIGIAADEFANKSELPS